MADKPIEVVWGTGTAVMRPSSIGVVLGIMPWNFPYYQVARFAAPNLAVGNSILLKHAPQCPQSALAMEAIFTEAGVPADAYVNIFATNEQVAGIIADHLGYAWLFSLATVISVFGIALSLIMLRRLKSPAEPAVSGPKAGSGIVSGTTG